jgi:ubiquinol-cytochrome c reductase cytochrome b subunit
MSRFGDWFEERLPIARGFRKAVDEEIPGGPKFTYALGSTTLLTFLVLAVTGIVQLFYYTPTTASAYDSVNFLRLQVPFGWLVHGLHYWAATLMVVLALLHLTQVFLWGAFKKPREMTWVLGVLLLLGTLGAVFTGGPLAWDEKGYWAARVGAGIAGSVPLIGGWLRNVVFGGPTIGQLTITRFFGLHVAVIPIVIAAILGTHLFTFRKEGAAGPMRASIKTGPFYPDQVLRDLVVFAAALALTIGLSAFLLTPVSGAADPLDATFTARPDWPFLFLFQTLKYLPGALEPLGTVGIPLVGTLLLLLVPWLDRSSERSPAKRPVAVGVFVLGCAGLVALSVAGASSTGPVIAAPTGAPGPTPDSSIVSTPPVPGASIASRQIGGAEHGATLFVLYCQECHGAKGATGVDNPGSVDASVPAIDPIDPEIKGKTAQAFVDGLDGFLQNGSVPDATPTVVPAGDTSAAPAPDTVAIIDTPRLKMPSFGNTYALSQPQIADLEAYVMQLNGVDRAAIVKAGVAPLTYFWVSVVLLGLVVIASGVAIVTAGRR